MESDLYRCACIQRILKHMGALEDTRTKKKWSRNLKQSMARVGSADNPMPISSEDDSDGKRESAMFV